MKNEIWMNAMEVYKKQFNPKYTQHIYLIENSKPYESSKIHVFMSFEHFLSELELSFDFFTWFTHVSTFNYVLFSSKHT